MTMPSQKVLHLEYPHLQPLSLQCGIYPPLPRRWSEFPPEILPFLLSTMYTWAFHFPRRAKLSSVQIACLLASMDTPIRFLVSRGCKDTLPLFNPQLFVVTVIVAGRLASAYFDAVESAVTVVYWLLSGTPSVPWQRWRHFQYPTSPTAKNLPLQISQELQQSKSILRILFFPALIYSTQIVEGYALIGLYGWNPGWVYTGDDAWAQGTVRLRLSDAFTWWVVGVVVEVADGWHLLSLDRH